FRPTMLRTGPDGALYIADMYRRVIEHPEYFPEELKHRPDIRAGEDKGRIYRVYPEGAKLRPIPRLDQPGVTNLIKSLASANGWERDLAQRMLIWRDPPPPETELVRVWTEARNPRVRIQALSTLAGLGRMTESLAFDGLSDRDSAVKEFAVRLIEPILRNPPEKGIAPNLASALLQCVTDTNIRVRYQLALTLGEWADPRAAKALAKIALQDRDNARVQTAVLSSARHHAAAMLDVILADAKDDPPSDLLAQLLNLVIVSHDETAAAKALERVARPASDRYAAWQMATIAALLDALERHGGGLKALQSEAAPAARHALAKLGELLAAIQTGTIAAAEVSPAQQQRLMRHSEQAIRLKAEKLFAARNPDRQKLVENYAAVNRLSGDAARGAPLYRQNCAACHRLKGEGTNVGPDLGTVADKPVVNLLVAILDPNQAFENKYINYTALTRDGREISGIIASETSNSITLRNAGGKDEVVLRSEIKELASSRLSLMPEGFENVLKQQEMADLIAYIRSR